MFVCVWRFSGSRDGFPWIGTENPWYSKVCMRPQLRCGFYGHQIQFGDLLAKPMRKIRFRRTHPNKTPSLCSCFSGPIDVWSHLGWENVKHMRGAFKCMPGCCSYRFSMCKWWKPLCNCWDPNIWGVQHFGAYLASPWGRTHFRKTHPPRNMSTILKILWISAIFLRMSNHRVSA